MAQRTIALKVRPVTRERSEAALAQLDRIDRLRSDLLRERGGRRFSDSTEEIHAARYAEDDSA